MVRGKLDIHMRKSTTRLPPLDMHGNELTGIKHIEIDQRLCNCKKKTGSTLQHAGADTYLLSKTPEAQEIKPFPCGFSHVLCRPHPAGSLLHLLHVCPPTSLCSLPSVTQPCAVLPLHTSLLDSCPACLVNGPRVPVFAVVES